MPNSNKLDIPWDPETDEEKEQDEKSLNETVVQSKDQEMEIEGAHGGSAPPMRTEVVFTPQMMEVFAETINREVRIAVALEMAKLSRGEASADAVGTSVDLGLRSSSPRDGSPTPKIQKPPRRMLQRRTSAGDLTTGERRRSSTPWDPKTPLGKIDECTEAGQRRSQ
uniref:Uncharacterized protein n=1 Tax=Trichogramma kaykai TaxID=54128 RepID=A0ABD2WP35_9HYME